MLSHILRRSSSNKYLGISMHADGWALAVVEAGKDNTLSTQDMLWLDALPAENRGKRLVKALKQLKARKLPATVVLDTNQYQLLQIESPDLPDEELAEALRWRIKDMVDYDVEHAAIDVFALPKSNRPGSPSLVHVVSADANYLTPLIDELTKAHVNLQAIDIAELALRNLVNRQVEVIKPRAYLYLSESVGVIEINHDSEVYLTRQMRVDAQAVMDSPEELLNIAEGLALEVQRSLDYFESQYGLGQVDSLQLLAPNTALGEAFKQAAELFLTVSVHLDKFEYLPNTKLQGEPHAAQALLAIGAGAREIPCLN